MKKYGQILSFIHSNVWAILPETLEMIMDLVYLRRDGTLPTEEEIAERLGAARDQRMARVSGNLDMVESEEGGPQQYGSTMVIPIEGVISQKLTLMQKVSGGTSTDQVGAWVDQAMGNQEIRSIALAVDSPGGSVIGLEELAQKIMHARESKRVVAVAIGQMASAAYYLASQADEIVAGPSTLVGSIGTIAVHSERSVANEKAGVKHTIISAGKHKTDGNSFKPLDEQGKSTLTEMVDSYYDQFVSAVARGRGIPESKIRGGYGQGKVLIAKEAKAAGMVDQIGTLRDVLGQLSQRTLAGMAGL